MKKNKLMKIIVAVLLIATFLPTTAFAADITAYVDKGNVSVTTTGDNTGTVDYVDDAGVSYTGVTFGTGDTVTVTQTAGTTTANSIAINTAGGDVGVVIDDINISGSAVGIDITGGNTATVELDGENNISINELAAIGVSGGSTVVIEDANGDGGKIDAKTTGANTKDPAIGARGNSASGSIVINSGIVNATGAYMGAGIGGGLFGSAAISITGGTVTATGGDYGAGIGGGIDSYAAISISGGTVTATGGRSAAGIGAGNMNDAKISITGGNVTANASGGGAAIGGGPWGDSEILISGGTIDATAGFSGAGIGGGVEGDAKISITGGTINAAGTFRGAGIGGGCYGDTEISVTGGTITATGGQDGAGIGSGIRGNTTVDITGGDITAQGGSGGAGIGSGKEGTSTVKTQRYRILKGKTYSWQLPFLGETNTNFLENVHGGAGAEDVGSGAGGWTSDVTFIDVREDTGYTLVFTLKDTAEKYERYVGWMYLDDYSWFTQGRDTTDWANGFLPLSYNVDGDTLEIETDEEDVTLQLDMRGLWDLNVTKVVLKNGGSETTFSMADFDCDLAKIVLEGAAVISTVYDSEAEAA